MESNGLEWTPRRSWIEQERRPLLCKVAFVARPSCGQLVEARAGLDALAQIRRSGEEIDRRNLVDKFVGTQPPLELVRCLIVTRLEEGDARTIRPKALLIRHMQLDAAARFARVLLKHRREHDRPKRHA